jgi:glyoxylase-like metal-dependent hydrolase (beta-lactamase superfamily II)
MPENAAGDSRVQRTQRTPASTGAEMKVCLNWESIIHLRFRLMNNLYKWVMQAILFALLLTTTTEIEAQAIDYKVYAVKFADSTYPFTIGDWADGGPKTERVEIDFMVWLIKGTNGKNILVDAGFMGDNKSADDFKIADYIRPDSALMTLGVKPQDITDIILSHPHWDHMDGIGLFPNAQIWMQKDDFDYFVGAAWQKEGNHGGFSKDDVKHIVDLNLNGKLTLVEGDGKQILPGVTVHTGSKHTFNSQYVLVDTGKNKVVLASDNIWIYYSLDHLVPPSQGGTWDPQGYVKAMQRMKSMVTDTRLIIPGHDGAIFKRFPVVAKGIVEIK